MRTRSLLFLSCLPHINTNILAVPSFLLIRIFHLFEFVCNSLAFTIYGLILLLLHLYATTGRHASPTSSNPSFAGGEEIELRDTSGGGGANKWYARVPQTPLTGGGGGVGGAHVLGDDDD